MENEKVEGKKEFWKTKVYGFEDKFLFGLVVKLNEFYDKNFVIATQIFNSDGKWQGVVWFKVKPTKKAEGADGIKGF